jgi:transcriptional regulator with XRE-family HTH domain
MDQRKIGSFISALRHEKGLTQAELGEKLGVTNKTISRWENGNYMPDIEMMKLLSEFFGVSINELLSGERISDEAFRKIADENIIAVSKSTAFSVKEQLKYWKRKWIKEHIGQIFICVFFYAAMFTLGWVYSLSWVVGACPILGIIVYIILRNKMMIYTEDKVYGKGM